MNQRADGHRAERTAPPAPVPLRAANERDDGRLGNRAGFLKSIPSSGTAIDLRFVDSDKVATAEYEAVVKKFAGFGGTTVHNAVIDLARLGKESVPPTDLTELTSPLR